MTLREILEQASQIFIKAPNTAADRDLLLFYINFAAKEFWEAQDRPDSIREKTFFVGENKIMSMPSYLGRLRAIRTCCDTALVVTRQSRYQTGDWARQCCHKFTVLGTSPLKVPGDLSKFTVECLELEQCSVDLTITGRTTTAETHHVKIPLNAGDRIFDVAQPFMEIKSISKTAKTNSNVVIRDAQGLEIADIPNDQLSSRYLMIEIGPRCSCNGACDCAPPTGQAFDVLYKLPFTPLVEDDDIYPIEGYENLFFYKMMEVKKLTGEEDPEVGVEMLINKQAALAKVADYDQNQAFEMKLDMGRNPFKYLKRRTSQRFYVDEDSPGSVFRK